MRWFLLILLVSRPVFGAEVDTPKWQIDEARQAACDGFERVYTWQDKLDHEKAIEKVAGVYDKEIRYRAGRAIVDGKKEAIDGMKLYEKLSGKNFTQAVLDSCWESSEGETK